MKSFFVLLLIVLAGWGAWYFVHRANTDNSVAVVNTETPVPLYGQGGQGTVPPGGYVEPGTTSQGSTQTVATRTPTPVVRRTPVPNIHRTPVPVPTATQSPAPTEAPTPEPVLAFRDLGGINGFSEKGTLVISSTADGRTQINFNVANAPSTGTQPAYIYRGASCQASQEVVFGLNPLVAGSSVTILPISAANLLSQNNL